MCILTPETNLAAEKAIRNLEGRTAGPARRPAERRRAGTSVQRRPGRVVADLLAELRSFSAVSAPIFASKYALKRFQYFSKSNRLSS